MLNYILLSEYKEHSNSTNRKEGGDSASSSIRREDRSGSVDSLDDSKFDKYMLCVKKYSFLNILFACVYSLKYPDTCCSRSLPGISGFKSKEYDGNTAAKRSNQLLFKWLILSQLTYFNILFFFWKKPSSATGSNSEKETEKSKDYGSIYSSISGSAFSR